MRAAVARARASGRGPAVARAVALAVVGLLLVAGCGGGTGAGAPHASQRTPRSGDGSASGQGSRATGLPRIPGVAKRLQAKIPEASRQVVAVYGAGEDASDATVVLYTAGDDTAGDAEGAEKTDGGGDGVTWTRERAWRGHNGKRGWTTAHREGDKRSPVGVFTLSDAGGVLPDPGAKLPYSRSPGFTPPSYWSKKTRHDFDYVIAIDYNRVRGTSPLDPARPQGQAKGGSIWLHMDHGSGTSGCVSISRSGMEYLLRTLDPQRHPVAVMGDRATLSGR